VFDKVDAELKKLVVDDVICKYGCVSKEGGEGTFKDEI
jgi:hypothetical protein